MGKTSSAVKNRYNTKAYDRIALTVTKGNRDALRVISENVGESVNAFVNKAIEQRIKNECPGAEYAFSDRADNEQ